MAVSITIQRVSEDAKCLNKNPVDIASLTCHIKGECSIEEPIFILNTNNAYLSANYLYCSTWGKYYFITEPPTVSEGGTMELHCKEDYLMSFRNEISNMECLIARNEFDRNDNIPDSNMAICSKRQVEGYSFGNSLVTNDTSYILGVI